MRVKQQSGVDAAPTKLLRMSAELKMPVYHPVDDRVVRAPRSSHRVGESTFSEYLTPLLSDIKLKVVSRLPHQLREKLVKHLEEDVQWSQRTTTQEGELEAEITSEMASAASTALLVQQLAKLEAAELIATQTYYDTVQKSFDEKTAKIKELEAAKEAKKMIFVKALEAVKKAIKSEPERFWVDNSAKIKQINLNADTISENDYAHIVQYSILKDGDAGAELREQYHRFHMASLKLWDAEQTVHREKDKQTLVKFEGLQHWACLLRWQHEKMYDRVSEVRGDIAQILVGATKDFETRESEYRHLYQQSLMLGTLTAQDNENENIANVYMPHPPRSLEQMKSGLAGRHFEGAIYGVGDLNPKELVEKPKGLFGGWTKRVDQSAGDRRKHFTVPAQSLLREPHWIAELQTSADEATKSWAEKQETWVPSASNNAWKPRGFAGMDVEPVVELDWDDGGYSTRVSRVSNQDALYYLLSAQSGETLVREPRGFDEAESTGRWESQLTMFRNPSGNRTELSKLSFGPHLDFVTSFDDNEYNRVGRPAEGKATHKQIFVFINSDMRQRFDVKSAIVSDAAAYSKTNTWLSYFESENYKVHYPHSEWAKQNARMKFHASRDTASNGSSTETPQESLDRQANLLDATDKVAKMKENKNMMMDDEDGNIVTYSVPNYVYNAALNALYNHRGSFAPRVVFGFKDMSSEELDELQKSVEQRKVQYPKREKTESKQTKEKSSNLADNSSRMDANSASAIFYSYSARRLIDKSAATAATAVSGGEAPFPQKRQTPPPPPRMQNAAPDTHDYNLRLSFRK